MADNKSSRDEKQKSYYSLNLTEGRRFVLFIVFVIIIVVLLIGVWFVWSSFSKNNRNAIKEDIKSESTLASYYDSLTIRDSLNSADATGDMKGDGSEKTDSTALNSDSSEKTAVQTKVDFTSDAMTEETSAGNADDSEVLYASKFKNEDDDAEKPKYSAQKNKTVYPVKKKKSENKNKTVKNESVKTAKTDVKSEAKKVTKKYVVQIGSYSNKKTADEIAAFYQNHGNYPTFVRDTVSNGKTFYRLRVGPFTDKSRAEQYLTYLKDTKYGKKSYISEIYR